MPFFDGVKGRVYYKTWQPETAAAGVVFLHGFGEHSGLYHRYGAALNARAIALWALDQIGHGLTDGERGVVESLDDLAENGQRLTSIAERQQPGLPLVVAGHSLGGVTAALTAVRHPERYVGVVLSGTPISPLAWARGRRRRRWHRPRARGPLRRCLLSRRARERPARLHERRPHRDDARRRCRRRGRSSRRASSTVSLPVLFVHGGDDPIAPVESARSWAGRVPDGRLAEFAGARHDVLNETVHREVSARIADFVLDVSRRPSGEGAAGAGSSR